MNIKDLECDIRRIYESGHTIGFIEYGEFGNGDQYFAVYRMPEGDWGIFVLGAFSDGFETLEDVIRFGLKQVGMGGLMGADGKIYSQKALPFMPQGENIGGDEGI